MHISYMETIVSAGCLNYKKRKGEQAMNNKELEIKAYNIRKNAVTAVYSAASGHPGGSLSAADLMAVLYFDEMNIDPKNPTMEDRDRFVLSKGHCSPALYGALAEAGYFDKEELKTFRHTTSRLQGHPDMKHIPGVDMTTGSLGLGVSAACGMALSAKAYNKSYRVYSLLGDGEIEEGQVWEAAMYAAHYKLDNLCIFIDLNGLQIDGATAEVMNSSPLDEKFKAFGWNVICCDGHDYDELKAALAAAKTVKGRPTAVIMKTVKGKGVSYMENAVSWHGSAPNEEQYNQAISELDAHLASLM